MPILVDIPVAPGSSVDLCAIFINAAADLADMVALRYVGDSIQPATRADVEVRRLANRTRVIRKGSGAVAVMESLSVTFERCTPDQVNWLRDHVGELVCVRDHVGGKFFGVYSEVPREVASFTRERAKVSLSFAQVTYSEAV